MTENARTARRDPRTAWACASDDRMPVSLTAVVDANKTMHDALRRFGAAIVSAVRFQSASRSASRLAYRLAYRLASRLAYRMARLEPRGTPVFAAVAIVLCAGAGGASAAGAEGPAAASAPPATVVRGVSRECLSIGEIVEKIARWRDAGGALQRAQTEIARRIADPDARAVAVSLVAQLYTGFARQMTPAQAREAYAASCALAQENNDRAVANPTAPGTTSAPPAPPAPPATIDASPARAP